MIFNKAFFRILTYIPPLFEYNPRWIERIQKLFDRFFKHTISQSDFTVNAEILSEDEFIQQSIKFLKKYGIVVITGYVDENYAKKARNLLISEVHQARHNICCNQYYENDQMVVQREPYTISSFDDMMNENRAVFNIRGSGKGELANHDDYGMIDVFGVNKLVPLCPYTSRCIDIIQSEKIRSVIEQARNRKVGNRITTNLYYNKSVTQTRGLHIDAITNEYKVFMYLTTVDKIHYGPYSYVPKSNRLTMIHCMNMLFNKVCKNSGGVTTTNFCNKKHSIKIYGKPGDLIISDQKGAHAGTPQRAGYERVLLVQGYYE